MIGAPRGRRALPSGAWLGLAMVLLLGAALAARPAGTSDADPTLEAARQRTLASRADAAALALEELQAQLAPARAAAREGAARIVDGDEPPMTALLDAAQRLEAATAAAGRAGAAMDRLRGTAAAVAPELVVPVTPTTAELLGIAAQLRGSADAAESFVERRWMAQRTLEGLAAALDTLDAGHPRSALQALGDAQRALADMEAWEPAPVTLPLWLETTDRLIAATRGIAEATLAGDPQAARRAGRAYARAAQEAHRADVSLALSLSETGSGLTAAPLRRLADVLAAAEEARVLAASLVRGDP